MSQKTDGQKSTDEVIKEKEKRFAQAISLEIPDRIPFELGFGYFPARYAGITCEATYYDYDAWLAASKKTLIDFGVDFSRVQPFFPGKVLELMDVKPLSWPGHGCSPLHSHQYTDIEAMLPGEYDLLLNDTADYRLRYYLPRIAGVMEPFNKVSSLSSISFGYNNALTLAEEFSRPEVVTAFHKMQQSGEELSKWRPRLTEFTNELTKLGFPNYTPMRALAPFDMVSDHLRGMRGSMLDMYRQPDKLLETCNFILDKMIKNIKPVPPGSNIRCGIPLHRGAEGFMSIKQFETFYWPTLKGLILALIDNGYIPSIAFEGDYTSRLEYLLELPKGKIFAHMDTTDIYKAKAVLSGHMCISGNIPISLLRAGSPDDVREECRKMIDVCGKGGGFIMSTRTTLDDARPDNVKAMIDFTLDYGVYR
jgi:hypothetical protein